MNKMKYIAINGDEVIAYIVENPTYGMVILFLTTKIDITNSIRIFEIEDWKEVYNQDLLDLVWFPFPSYKLEK